MYARPCARNREVKWRTNWPGFCSPSGWVTVWERQYIKHPSLMAGRKTGGKGRVLRPFSKDEKELVRGREEASVLWVCTSLGVIQARRPW